MIHVFHGSDRTKLLIEFPTTEEITEIKNLYGNSKTASTLERKRILVLVSEISKIHSFLSFKKYHFTVLWIFELHCLTMLNEYYNFRFECEASLIIYLPSRFKLSRPDPGRREKINLSFYFHTFLWFLKRSYESLKGLHKTSWGTTKKCVKMVTPAYLFWSFSLCWWRKSSN